MCDAEERSLTSLASAVVQTLRQTIDQTASLEDSDERVIQLADAVVDVLRRAHQYVSSSGLCPHCGGRTVIRSDGFIYCARCTPW